MNHFKITSLEILKEQISITRGELSFSLTVADLERLLPHGHTKINEMLRKYDYPEANPEDTIPNRKIGGRRVIPRDWFLAWYYGETENKKIEEEYKVDI
ncbi:MAG: hypothetical protein ACOCRX_11920 [Candidatus Woesearchaeota archaeon]